MSYAKNRSQVYLLWFYSSYSPSNLQTLWLMGLQKCTKAGIKNGISSPLHSGVIRAMFSLSREFANRPTDYRGSSIAIQACQINPERQSIECNIKRSRPTTSCTCHFLTTCKNRKWPPRNNAWFILLNSPLSCSVPKQLKCRNWAFIPTIAIKGKCHVDRSKR